MPTAGSLSRRMGWFEVLAVDSGDVQTPLLVVMLPTLFGSIIGLAGLAYAASTNSRSEHRRWLRQERLKAYSTFVEVANDGLEAINAMLIDRLQTGQGDLGAIVRRAEQTSNELQRPVGSIMLLGPQHVSVASGAVRLSFGWSAKALLELLGELDLGASLTDDRVGTELAGLVLTQEQQSRWVQEVTDVLTNFKHMAAQEIQTHRPGMEWRRRVPKIAEQ